MTNPNFNRNSTWQRPQTLKQEDTLIAIAPSGTLRTPERLNKGLEVWRNRGYNVILQEDYNAREGYLAGNDEVRRRALKEAWENPEYKAILCVRGGYGAARLLEQWQWQNIESPKWLIGFSDITALLWSLCSEKIVGLHAPVLTTIAEEPDWSIDRLFTYLETGEIAPLEGKGWGNGKATGRLLPANLTVATNILNTPVCPHLDGVILAFEDVGEAPYRIDRMLTQWRSSGFFDRVKGIALGRFSGSEVDSSIPSWTVEQVLHDRLEDLSIPIVSDLLFGHDGVNACLPAGEQVNIDGDNGILTFNNSFN